MKKLFIVGDVHGYYDELMTALNEKGFDINNPDHIFVSLGDLLDRGTQPRECLQFVNSIPSERKMLVLGNHEELTSKMIKRKFPYGVDFHNGTAKTVFDFYGIDMADSYKTDHEKLIRDFANSPEWTEYIKYCKDYYETKHSVFVHGWIPCNGQVGYYGEMYNPSYSKQWRLKSWEQARWYNGMEMWEKGVRVPNKTIYCGHWHTSWGHAYLHDDGVEWLDEVETGWIDEKTGRLEPHMNSDPFEDEGICAMDACTAVTGHVNCKVIEEDL